MNTLIQIPDAPNTNTGEASFYGFDAVHFYAGQFILIEDLSSNRQYFGQVIAAQLNLNRDALGQFDNTTISRFEALQKERFSRDVAVREVFLYRIQFLKEVTTRTTQSVRRRPQIGAIARAATEEEIILFLSLPPAEDTMLLGHLIDSQVSVCMSDALLFHHILVAGATGKGKSNTIANLITGAQESGFFSIVNDHKPDYIDMDQPNDEGAASYYRGLAQVHCFHLGESMGKGGERGIVVPASDLGLSALARALFHYPGEEQQAESMHMILLRFEQDHQHYKPWSLQDVITWLPRTAKDYEKHHNEAIHELTYNAILAKLKRPDRKPDWVDGTLRPSERAQYRTEPFSLEDEAGPGRILVIRIDNSKHNGREYGLWLSYMLKRLYTLRDKNIITCPVANFIDEAQDIFDAGSSFQNAMGGMLSNYIRKGRSRKIGTVLGVQSANAIPTEILNNLNSQFIFGHNHPEQAKPAMARATKEQIAMTATLDRGECLAYLFGSNGIIHCQMRRSPFRLYKD